jgi:hypothetical protein
MGETADEVKRDAKQVASEQMEKAKDTAEQFVDDAVNVPGNGAQWQQSRPEHFG